MKQTFDYNKLRGRIVEYCGTIENFASKMGISQTSIYKKLNNSVPFTQYEINLAIKILKIKQSEIKDIFFTKEV